MHNGRGLISLSLSTGGQFNFFPHFCKPISSCVSPLFMCGWFSYFNDGVMIFQQGREQEDGEPENKKASLEEPTEGKHRLVHHTTHKNVYLFVFVLF